MSKLKVIMVLFLILLKGQAQKDLNSDNKKVILLGSFHYGNTTDANRTDFPDLFSEKRQKEIEKLTDQLAKLGIDKVFIERQEKYQEKYDSLYKLFLSGKLKDTVVSRPEEIQIGFRVAQKSNLKKVFCVDVKQALPYDEMKAFETKFKDKKDAPFFLNRKYPFSDRSSKLNLSEQTLSEYYLNLNSDYSKKYHLYDYLHYAMSYVNEDEFVGPKFTAVWYERNLKIFSKILNSLTAEDKTIFVIYGSSHTFFFEEFFKSNPHFKVIKLKDILKK